MSVFLIDLSVCLSDSMYICMYVCLTHTHFCLTKTVPSVPTYCFDIMMMGKSTDEVYTITPNDYGESMDVWCEVQSEESWLVSSL